MDLGGTATPPLQATTVHHSQLRDRHAEELHIHDNHHNIDTSIKTMALKAVNSTYIFTLHNVSTGYMGSSTKDTMDNLMSRCGHIMAADIKIKKTPPRTLVHTTSNKCVIQDHR